MSKTEDKIILHSDITIIGAGIMSASYAILLHEFNPKLKINIFERLPELAKESSDAWNNAGTGHSAFCELNYTPLKNGRVDISKAIHICKQFEISKSFWAYLIEKYNLITASNFIHRVAHISFVWGEENTHFLKLRHEALVQHPFFADMAFITNKERMIEIMPLVMDSRSSELPMAMTYMEQGTDVNFGSLTHSIFEYLEKQEGINIYRNHEVSTLEQIIKGHWQLEIKDLKEEETILAEAPYVFVGAGGGALELFEKSNIEEAAGYGGFPISGLWLRCINQQVIEQHQTKVYGMAEIGTPPMSVPHLDTRFINGKKELLFGPFAGFSTKFLKEGSFFDLPASIEWDNIIPMISAGWHNIELTKYLFAQLKMTQEERIMVLRDYYPNANGLDWELAVAGQRVQVIKKNPELGGILEFGTEVIASEDGRIAGILGASPGASTAISIMLDVIQKMFPQNWESSLWQLKLKQMLPIYFENDIKAETLQTFRQKNKDILQC